MNEKLAAELEFKLHQLEEFSSTLLFHRLRPEHRGNYTCLAKNSVAQDAYSQMMTIFGKFARLIYDRRSVFIKT